MHRSQVVSELEEKIEYQFKNRSLLLLACTHRSYVNENREIKEHNERLEFLGDSVLGMLVAEYLYTYLPNTPEGELSFLRSRIVEASSCYAFAVKLDLTSFLSLGKGEQMSGKRGKDTILADFFEALIGAIYLDGGLEAAKKFLFQHFQEEIEAIIRTPVHNWKALLQDYCQKTHRVKPTYQVLEEQGPDHHKHFRIAIFIEDRKCGEGIGASKKEAQQSAAEAALKYLNAMPP